MRRPSPITLALCIAAMATGAALLPATGRALRDDALRGDAVLGDALRTSTAAAMMADEPSAAVRTVLDGLRAIRATTAGIGTTDASDVTAGIHGAAPAGVEVVAPAAEAIDAAAATAVTTLVTTLVANGDATDDATARLLEEEGPGTYIDELLRTDGAVLTRWPARGETPLRYWIQPGAGLPDYVPENRRQVTEAFAAWERAGIPLRFAGTTDSAAADIVVVWTPRFDEPISGKTRWMHDRRGWIQAARVTLALHRYTGEQLSGDALHAIALHEVGHSLGLDHTSDVANVMAPRVRVRELSDADRATARLLYRLPPGLRR